MSGLSSGDSTFWIGLLICSIAVIVIAVASVVSAVKNRTNNNNTGGNTGQTSTTTTNLVLSSQRPQTLRGFPNHPRPVPRKIRQRPQD
jgi:hypothetical protein